MNINELKRGFLNNINNFLSSRDNSWPSDWETRETIREQAISFIDSSNDETFFGSNEEYVIGGLALLPNLRNVEEIPRDFDLKRFYKYNDNACSFSSFNIGKYVPSYLNDSKEGKWFDEFMLKMPPSSYGKATPAFGKMLTKYNPLVTYTTTTLDNHKYMISNYSRVGKMCIGYDGEQLLNNYDSLFSGKIKPIRGFVRYSDIEKDDFKTYIYALISVKPAAAELLLAIAATFIKGVCMKEEAEYRFLILTTNSLDSLDINCLSKGCNSFVCVPGNTNPFYDEGVSECPDTNAIRCDNNNCNQG